MMRIAFLTTDSREHYRDYGNPEPYFGSAPAALLQGLARRPELEVHVISCLQAPVDSPEKLADNTWYHGLHVPKWGWLRTGYRGCARAVRQCLEKIQPDLVHGQGTERDCAFSAVRSGWPNVITIHGNMQALAQRNGARPFSFHWITARLEKFVLTRTRGVICNSGYTERQVAAQARQTWRVPNPVQSLFFTPVHRTPSKVPQLINVGTILPYKRQVELLDVAASLHRRGRRFKLVFVGVADPNSTYVLTFLNRMREAESAGFGSFIPLQTPEALRNCLDQSAAMVHVPTEESFGLVVAEALSRNLKVFVSRTGGIVDVVETIPAAQTFESRDWSGLESALEAWLNEGAPAPPASQSEMIRRYHPDVIARQHSEIYQSLMAGKPTA